MGAKGRVKWKYQSSNAPRGEEAPTAVLTAKVVRMLRRKLREDGTLNYSHWARKLGAKSAQTIANAVNGSTWRWLK